MKIDQILDLIGSLAQSQGMYGRQYRDLMEIKNYDPAQWKRIVAQLESQNFRRISISFFGTNAADNRWAGLRASLSAFRFTYCSACVIIKS